MKLPKLGRKSSPQAEEEAPATDKQRKNAKEQAASISLGRLSVLMLVGVVVVLTLFAAAAYYFENQQARLLQAAEADRQAHRLAEGVATELRDVSARLAAIAANAAVLKAVTSGSAGQRETLAEELKLAFPGVWRLRLMPRNVTRIEDGSEPALGYAGLDMLNRSLSSGKRVPAEVHGRGGKHPNIVVVQPVVNPVDNEVVGHVMVHYKQSSLSGWLAASGQFPGQVSVAQSTGRGETLELFSAGAAPVDAAGEQAISIPGTSWSLVYSADLALTPTNIQTLVILGALLLGALVLNGALIFGLHGRYRKALRTDLATIKSFLDGREVTTSDSVTVQVEELRETINTLWQVDVDTSYDATEDLATEAVVDLDLELDLGDEGGEFADVPAAVPVELPMHIFRAYDIRGVVGTDLTSEVVTAIGRAFGSEVYEQGEQSVVIGRDGRHSGPELTDALSLGLRNSGRDVKDIGLVPTPVLYFATHFLGAKSGVMLTGSHNPPDYNGLKMVLNGEAMAGPAIYQLRERLMSGNLLAGHGDVDEVDIVSDYIARVSSDINVERPLRLVVDCGNGSASDVAPELLRELGCEVTELFCEVDGSFPNHHPDPSQPENLAHLAQEVKAQNADLGLAFDGDGDRLGVVSSRGEIIWPDRLMMLFAQDVLTRNPGAVIIYDVKCSSKLGQVIQQFGGRPLMWNSGHSLIKARMKETGALLGGELSGHIFFRERWFGFDDALYAAARLLEILSFDPRSSAEIFDELPNALNTPELRAELPEGRNFAVMDKIMENVEFPGAQVTTIDGLRVDYPDGWGLVRASNTLPVLTFRFEADDKAAMHRIQDAFRERVLAADSSVPLPF